MGNKPENHQAEFDVDDDDNLSVLKQYIKEQRTMICTDAITSTSSSRNQKLCQFELIESNFDVILNDLNENEKISIIFLLENDHHIALHQMEMLNSDDSFFKCWLSPFFKDQNKQWLLLEALCLLQNYYCLKQMGVDKEEATKVFHPDSFKFSLHVNKLQRFLYKVCDDLDPDQEENLMNVLKKNLPDMPNHYKTMEEYFTFSFTKSYFQSHDMSKLKSNFKEIDLLFYADLLGTFYHNFKSDPVENVQQTLSELCPDNTANMPEINLQELRGKNVVQETNVVSEDVYKMDPENPGICLIIENQFFYKEYEHDTHLVINTGLKDRVGTKHDSTKLKDIFKRFGYRVIYEENKSHLEIEQIVHKAAFQECKKTDSSFVLIILSHGVEGGVVACNSISVSISKIQELMNSKHLEGKPKILIVQACQGSAIQKINSDVELDSGEPSKCSPSKFPHTKHVITFWATVEGYASFRSPSSGTWLIQCLVDVLESDYREQFSDICTKVMNKIAQKEWLDGQNINIMVPIFSSTLEKKLFLPPLKAKTV